MHTYVLTYPLSEKKSKNIQTGINTDDLNQHSEFCNDEDGDIQLDSSLDENEDIVGTVSPRKVSEMGCISEGMYMIDLLWRAV